MNHQKRSRPTPVQRNALRRDVDVRFSQSESGLTSGKTNTKSCFFDDCKGVPRHIDPTTFGAETLRPGPLSQGNRTYNSRGSAQDLSRRWAKARRIITCSRYVFLWHGALGHYNTTAYRTLVVLSVGIQHLLLRLRQPKWWSLQRTTRLLYRMGRAKSHN